MTTRARTAVASLPAGRGQSHSLSQRERVGVRENGPEHPSAPLEMPPAKLIQSLVTSSATKVGQRVPPVPPTKPPRLSGIFPIRSHAGSTALRGSATFQSRVVARAGAQIATSECRATACRRLPAAAKRVPSMNARGTAVAPSRRLQIAGTAPVGDDVRSLTSNAELGMRIAEPIQRLITSSPTTEARPTCPGRRTTGRSSLPSAFVRVIRGQITSAAPLQSPPSSAPRCRGRPSTSRGGCRPSPPTRARWGCSRARSRRSPRP
jgi:hypothetical protein